MTLSERRKELRHQAMTTAASMIRDYAESGEQEAWGLRSEEELHQFDQECKAFAKRIDRMADNFKKKHGLD